ncbi:HVA22-like protein f [Zea mays]|uniref:HVA22-like protein f n=1 Tax=Zea mays TaxID=4577 RepID=A0A1D6NDD7_MAIZE|nr:HVA22-like protein f [Zea mays]ONM38509.1 HVA22-like protein f [Zea mays]
MNSDRLHNSFLHRIRPGIMLLYPLFPPWPYMKLLFCCWLVLPIFNGAAYIYEAHVRRYFKIGSYVSPSYSERHRRVLQMTSLDARRSVERFIDTHGPDALDRIIRAAEQEAKRA